MVSMRDVRQTVRNLLLRHPVGERWVVPALQSAYDRLPFQDWRAKRYAATEGRRLLRLMGRGTEVFTIVYDGLSYGSLCYTLGVARFFTANGHTCNFVFKEEIDNPSLSPLATRRFHEEGIAIAERLLPPDRSSVRLCETTSLGPLLDEATALGKLVFDDYTRSGRSWGTATFNLLNWLMAQVPLEVQDEVLFRSVEFDDDRSRAGGPTVTWHCRYSEVDNGRQTTKEEFARSHLLLSNRFPDHQIVIISDQMGCDHYRGVAAELRIVGLEFSKEIGGRSANEGSGFLEDVARIMKSDFYYAFRGGGVSCFTMLSRLPFLVLYARCEESLWDRQRLCSWQRDDQTYVELAKYQFVRDRRDDLRYIPQS